MIENPAQRPFLLPVTVLVGMAAVLLWAPFQRAEAFPAGGYVDESGRVALATGGGPPSSDGDWQNETFTIEENDYQLAVPQAYTLRDDLVIRITQEGFDFLARQLQMLLLGWQKTNAAGTSIDTAYNSPIDSIPALLTDTLMGMTFCEQDLISGVDAAGMLGSIEDDNGDGVGCNCKPKRSGSPEGGCGGGNGYFESFASGTCRPRCVPGTGSSNPTRLTANYGGCPSGGVQGRKAYYKNPSNPDDLTPYYWCKGPFYDSSLTYARRRLDPDCVFHPSDDLNENNRWDAGETCPQMGITARDGTALTCDGQCNPFNANENDVRLDLTNNTPGQRIDLQLILRDLRANVWINGYGDVGPCWVCCYINCCADPPNGNYMNIPAAVIDGNARFVDGYYTMLGMDGDYWDGSGTVEVGAVGGSTSGPNLQNDPIVDAVISITNVDIQGANWGGLSIFSCGGGCSGVGCGLLGAFGGLLGGIIEGEVESLLQGLLNDEITGILRDSLGMPLDFTALLSGQPGTAKEICGIRSPSSPVASCSHGSNNCPCDDIDSDELMNYQDDRNPTGVDRAGDWNAFHGNGSGDGLNFWGYWPNGDYYHESMWGTGNGFGGLEGSDPPFYNIGAYADDFWDTEYNTVAGGRGGAAFLVDTTFVPRKSNIVLDNLGTTYSFPDDFNLRSCYPDAKLLVDATDGNDSLGTRTDGPGPLGDVSPANGIDDFRDMLSDWDYYQEDGSRSTAGGANHLVYIMSQQLLQEFVYAMYSSGILCIVVSQQNFDFLGDLLKVENFKMFVPLLGDTDASGNYYWDQQGNVEIHFQPSEIPTFRVLGARGGNCFPDGDLIAPAGQFNRHDVVDDGSEALEPANACTDGANKHNVYDGFLYMPQFVAHFYAPLASDGSMQRMFSMEWDLGLAGALEYSTATYTEPIGGASFDSFFEMVVDGFLGCGGQFFTTYQNDIPWHSGSTTSPTCQIRPGNVPAIPGYTVESGVSDFMHGLINSIFGVAMRTRLNLLGLDVHMNRIGYADVFTIADSRLDTDPAGDWGNGTPDFLVMTGRFRGAVDFAAIFTAIGGVSLAPPSQPPMIETYVSLPQDASSLQPRQWTQRQSLSPAESAEAGLTSKGSVALFDAAFAGVDADYDEFKYSWQLDGGLWRPYRPGNALRMPPLGSGQHVLRVKARGPQGLVSQTPAELSFYVDGVAPDIWISDAGGNKLTSAEAPVEVPHVYVDVHDNISNDETLKAEFRVDDGSWTEVRSRFIDLQSFVDDKVHRLEVRVSDDFGNPRVTTLDFVATDPILGGCGCRLGGAGTTWPGLLPFLLVLLLWRRTRKATAGAGQVRRQI